MSQNSLSIPDGSGLAVLEAIRDAFGSVASLFSGATSPSETNAHKLWADTNNGVVWRRNAADSGWVLHAPLADTPVVTISSNSTLGLAHYARTIFVSGNITLAFSAAVSLTNGWYTNIVNVGSSPVILDPNSSEAMDGQLQQVIPAGGSARIDCSGTSFRTSGLNGALSNVLTLTGATSLSYLNAWNMVLLAGSSGFTSTLPDVTSCRVGTEIVFMSFGASRVVNCFGSDEMNAGASLVTSVTLNAGDTMYARNTGASWLISGGSVSLRFANDFAANLSSSGWQRLPSGEIEVWGSGVTDGSGNLTASLPIAFPTSQLVGFSTAVSGSAVSACVTLASLTTTQIVFNAVNGAAAAMSGLTINYRAIGK